jgi:hypothetical protein
LSQCSPNSRTAQVNGTHACKATAKTPQWGAGGSYNKNFSHDLVLIGFCKYKILRANLAPAATPISTQPFLTPMDFASPKTCARDHFFSIARNVVFNNFKLLNFKD